MFFIDSVGAAAPVGGRKRRRGDWERVILLFDDGYSGSSDWLIGGDYNGSDDRLVDGSYGRATTD